MAVLAQFGGLAGCLADEQMRVLRDYGVLTPAAAAVASGGQSELTCNGGAGGGVVFPSRKRGRDAELDQCYMSASSSELLPIPGMAKHAFVPRQSAASARMVGSGMTSTSGRTAAGSSPVADELAAELCRQGAEVDALVRAECDRMVAGLEHARKRRCQALVTAAAGAAARALREKEAELGAARRRAADLEERVRQAAAESQAWCALARSNEAVATGLRATLDGVLLRAPVEGFGDSDLAFSPAAAEDDARSCCFVAKDAAAAGDTAASKPMTGSKWGCKACGEREATVLLLPCRHLCLCKACEPRLDACPVCLAAKNASIHIAAN